MVFIFGLALLVLLIVLFINIDSATLSRALKGLVIPLGIIFIGFLILSGRAGIVLSIMVAMLPFAIPVVVDFFRRNGSQRTSHAPRGGQHSMTREKACEVLGVGPNPTPESVQRAYKNLIRKVHPDQGGSAYLTAQLNEARDVLLK